MREFWKSSERAKEHLEYPLVRAVEPQVRGSRGKIRIALYSHDTMGLGHMRRNLLVAQSLSAPPLNAGILMIAGARQISKFTFPPGVDCLTLPSFHKTVDGVYGSRHLDVSLEELISLRSRTIRTALESFQPDLLIVDNVPRGALRELDESLFTLHRSTRIVLGLRDVLDAPDQVHTEWEEADNLRAIRKYYDAIWVYGDKVVYDLVSEYRFPADVAQKVQFVGYLNQSSRLRGSVRESNDNSASPDLPKGPLSICSVGGGQDGGALAETFAQAQLPPEYQAVVLTGPFMPTDARRRLMKAAERNSRLRVVGFIDEPVRLLSRADRLVAMGGYNTTCEVLSLNIPALVVPRTSPRVEQLLRAERLRRLGFLELLPPNQLSPQAISEWLAREPSRGNAGCVDLGGLDRLPLLAQGVLGLPPAALPNRAEGGFNHAFR